MQSIDLNLLVALDHLLREESVSLAAARMGLSAPAMSRTLGRIRDLTGDPILVRAGRRLVPTPRALAMRPRVHAVVEEAGAVLRAADGEPAQALERTFVVRASDAIAGILAGPLTRLLHTKTPRVTVRFTAEGDEDAEPLRDGRVDLDVGIMNLDAPELRVQTLFRDRFVGAVRAEHPLARGRVTAKRFAEAAHLSVSRRGRTAGPIDAALRELGLFRRTAIVLTSYYAALDVAAESDFVASVPARVAEGRRRTGLHVFALPVSIPAGAVSQSWHPRFDADPAHQWLRRCVRKVAK